MRDNNQVLNVAIVAGGDSGEYEISVKSAGQVAANLDPGLFKPWIITIRNNQWCHQHQNGITEVDRSDFSLLLDGRRIKFDLVFNAIHGSPGEDGKLQGYFDMIGIPYTSSQTTTSALTFDKNLCKSAVKNLGIQTAPWIFFRDGERIQSSDIVEKLGLPCFIKPNNGGSSVGMSKVGSEEDMEPAIHRALMEDKEILIEAFVEGRELTCGVFSHRGKTIVMPLTEIVSKKEFFDFEAKYQDGMAEEIVPANVDENTELKCKSISSFLYHKLNCKGVVRFDYIMGKPKAGVPQLTFLEVNTVPGLSENSIVPKMAKSMGYRLSDFFSQLIDDTLYRYGKEGLAEYQ